MHIKLRLASVHLQLQQLARAVSGRVVTTSACLAQSPIETMLRCGCAAVVCQASEPRSVAEPAQAASFFSALYQQLHAGHPLLQASRHAIVEHLCCYPLNVHITLRKMAIPMVGSAQQGMPAVLLQASCNRFIGASVRQRLKSVWSH